MSDRVTIAVDGGVADVRMNRPEKLNALDTEMFAALIEAAEAVGADPTVRAVVLSGEGRSFCAGLDFSGFQAIASREPSSDEGSSGEQRSARRAHPAHMWSELGPPVIAALRGHALGAGLQIALGADIRIVSPDAQLSVMEIRWGLVPDVGGTQLLPALVGLDVAKELTFTGRIVSGEEAVRLGMATRLGDEPLEDALALAREIAGKNPEAIRGAKRLLELAGRVDLEEGFAAERTTQGQIAGRPNQQEAVRAYFEKRDPDFVD